MTNKAYVVLDSIGTPGGPPFNGLVGGHYIVLEPDNTPTGVGGNLQISNVRFSYGDSGQAIKEAVVDAIRSQENDSALDVNFIGGD